MPETILEVAEPVRRVIDALLDRAVERVAAPGEDLGQERVGGILLGALVVDENLGQRNLRDILSGLLVDHSNFFALFEKLRDPLQRDVPAGFGVVQLAIGIALDQNCHGASLAGRKQDERDQPSMSKRCTRGFALGGGREAVVSGGCDVEDRSGSGCGRTPNSQRTSRKPRNARSTGRASESVWERTSQRVISASSAFARGRARAEGSANASPRRSEEISASRPRPISPARPSGATE